MSVQVLKPQSPESTPADISRSRISWLRSSLWLFLLIAACVRVYLIVHTHGVIDGDEGLVGMQAEHILRGERPVYFYAIPYMGSLEAYLAAIIFALVGPSVWALRAEPTILSLFLVGLTWKLASDLAQRSSLPVSAQRCFIWSASLVAALLPLYDVIIQMRTWGAWIEVFVVMLLILLSALHLTDRWQAGAPKKELSLRWAVIGFLVGLGFWLYPLVVTAVIAAAIWILTSFLFLVFHERKKAIDKPRRSFSSLFAELLLALIALPTALIGAAPAIYWGANNNWANVAFILQLGSNDPSLKHRLKTIYDVVKLYRTCVGPHVIGGRVTFESGLLHTLHSLTLYAGVFCVAVTLLLFCASLVWRTPFLMQMRHALALPLLFGACTFFIFISSSVSQIGLEFPCEQDFVGRYASPMMLVLPFFFATTLTAIVAYVNLKRHGQQHLTNTSADDTQPSQSASFVHSRFSLFLQGLGVALFLGYLGAQVGTYFLADPGYTFQSPYCMDALANNDPVIAYLEHEHIRYAWATNFLGNPITFKTNSNILAVDPTGVIANLDWLNRIPADTEAVRKSDRPSFIVPIPHSDVQPQLLTLLDKDHITYHVARFDSEPGTDVIVVTPLNKAIPLTKDYGNQFICHR